MQFLTKKETFLLLYFFQILVELELLDPDPKHCLGQKLSEDLLMCDQFFLKQINTFRIRSEKRNRDSR
jgi:hypothetical protein